MSDIDSILNKAKTLAQEIVQLELKDRVEVLNRVRRELHQVSPFQAEPVDLVLWIPAEDVQANQYNPNTVAPTEMELLRHSIFNDGYTQPIVGFSEKNHVEVVDGFHRNRVGREDAEIRERVHGYLPVVSINEGRKALVDRMAATVRHNRARGKHQVVKMSDIIIELTRRGWKDGEIAVELGMSADEVLRLKQITGLAELFKDREFSKSWGIVESDDLNKE